MIFAVRFLPGEPVVSSLASEGWVRSAVDVVDCLGAAVLPDAAGIALAGSSMGGFCEPSGEPHFEQ
jgi:hypothetical protein